MSEKTRLKLRTAEDCIAAFEEIGNSVTMDKESIAAANAKSLCVKGVIDIMRLEMDYNRLTSKGGGKIHTVSKFLASA